MSTFVRDTGPLPQGTLDTLSYINEKDDYIGLLEEALRVCGEAYADYGQNVRVGPNILIEDFVREALA